MTCSIRFLSILTGFHLVNNVFGDPLDDRAPDENESRGHNSPDDKDEQGTDHNQNRKRHDKKYPVLVQRDSKDEIAYCCGQNRKNTSYVADFVERSIRSGVQA